ncbi:uncharacterized protein LOC130742451 [Lotus japonicus]|uniref:uncharacterized protein LOC130742451 n=1 Tax=Lotus japonicus TaxID=34305 RepID=UPI00258E6A12|nr:uncharacterized protein LOC130742451 [Lotus japonicus]
MDRRKTLTMTWDDLADDEDDDDLFFFDSSNRLSSAIPIDLTSSSSSSDDDDDDDPRLSFVSAMSSAHSKKNRAFSQTMFTTPPDYDIWMASPASINERRRRLLYGMGLDHNKDFINTTTPNLSDAISMNFTEHRKTEKTKHTSPVSAKQRKTEKTEHSSVSSMLVRSHSEGNIGSFSMEMLRKENLIGKVSKQRLTRTATMVVLDAPVITKDDGNRVVAEDSFGNEVKSNKSWNSELGAIYLIKNLETGKEFILNEYGEDGLWNRLNDLQNRKKKKKNMLTMEEFENTIGHSHFVNELMRRSNVGRNESSSRKLSSSSSYISRSLKQSKKKGAKLLRNIKGVASGHATMEAKSNRWVRVRHNGKSHKELSALHLCQEVQAHEGCIWIIKFSLDGCFLASGGEDKVIRVWEVQECEVLEGNCSPLLVASPERNVQQAEVFLGEKKKTKKKGKIGGKRGNVIPDFVHVPETVFSLSEKPYCSFQGHLDDVLDLSWSKSQLLLSSSMDNTVRLWDLETKTCLKIFVHNDYVTCIHFNPVDDDYFISGSLDAKVRIWNIPECHVVHWIDTHEMVTAISYTPDGQGVLVGTHKGCCRTYSTQDSKLIQTATNEIRRKKKSKRRKVTGFEFAPGKPSEVLVTSADSRIRILDGSKIVHKFRGFRNSKSQIAASFSPDGRYVISASEDSQVYVWKHEEHRNAGIGKGRNMLVTRSHELFQCKDVSIAIPWPYTISGNPLPEPLHHSKTHSKISYSSFGGGDGTKVGAKIKTMLPPLPKKTKCHATEKEELEAISRVDSGIGDSFCSDSSSIRYGDSSSPSIPGSWSSSYSSFESGHGSPTSNLPSAWGLVIVTAGYEGEIRCYQNFGLPRRMRQANLFGGPS